ncbi:MAG: DMT family transporter [Lachnospiraceae bacterium]|nr:DMT family transporter [Lachnospiraceae bacterium]
MDCEESTINKTQLKGVILLLFTALIWGVSFVSQSAGMEKIEAFTFNGIRTLMGAAVLFPFIMAKEKMNLIKLDNAQLEKKKALDKKTVRYGAIMGIVFCAASNFQQFAFNYSTSGKIAFITAIYIFFVPLFGLFLKKKVSLLTWVSVVFVFVGLYFLCIDPSNLTGINKGDILAFICAILFAVHILLVEKYAPDVDGTKLACTQFVVSGLISCVIMFIFETPDIHAIKSTTIPLLYSGVMSCGLAYTFQIMGKKHTEATIASILMCMESVFAVIAAAIILHEFLTERELLGCFIIFAAIMLSQLSEIVIAKKAKLEIN